MAVDTILTAFRVISDLTTAQYSDQDVVDKAEPYAITTFNDIMGTSFSVTSHTTGEGANVDRSFAYLCASLAYQNLYPHLMDARKRSWLFFEQIALSAMQKMQTIHGPSKVAYSTSSGLFYAKDKQRGTAQFETYNGGFGD